MRYQPSRASSTTTWSPSARLPMTVWSVPGPERMFRPSSASWTVPTGRPGAHRTAHWAVSPRQVAVTVTKTGSVPVYRQVTVPSGATAAAAGSLLVQVTAAPSVSGVTEAVSVVASPAVRIISVTSRVRAYWSGSAGSSGSVGRTGSSGSVGSAGSVGSVGSVGAVGSPGCSAGVKVMAWYKMAAISARVRLPRGSTPSPLPLTSPCSTSVAVWPRAYSAIWSRSENWSSTDRSPSGQSLPSRGRAWRRMVKACSRVMGASGEKSPSPVPEASPAC